MKILEPDGLNGADVKSEITGSEAKRYYQYVKIKGGLVCLQQTPWSLLWLLYFRNIFRPAASLHLSPKMRRQAIKALILASYKKLNPDLTLTLPVYGNIGQRVHRGYRVFDFRRKRTSKVLRPYVGAALVAREIKAVKTSSDLSFAPSVRRWSLEEGWYEEDFMIGSSGYSIPDSDSAELLKIYRNQVAHFIKEMILLQPPIKVNLSDYLHGLCNILNEERIRRSNLGSAKISIIQSFLDDVAAEIRNSSPNSLDLVFSHGDFSFVNIVDTFEGLKIIDWESGARRSVLNDLYNYFFTELYYSRVQTNLAAEIERAISLLQASLETETPDLSCGLLASATYYRHLYYLERIKMLLERDLNDHLLDVIMRSLAVFNNFEVATGQRPFGTR